MIYKVVANPRRVSSYLAVSERFADTVPWGLGVIEARLQRMVELEAARTLRNRKYSLRFRPMERRDTDVGIRGARYYTLVADVGTLNPQAIKYRPRIVVGHREQG